MKYPFIFRVAVYNFEQHSTFKHYGMGIAENYSEAAAQIEEFFKDELVQIEHLEFHEESNLIFLPKESLVPFLNSDFPLLDFAEKEDADSITISEK